MRATSTLLLLSLASSSVSALPRGAGCHKTHTPYFEDKGNSLATSWSGVFHDVWESVRGTVFGLYDVDLYDELEKTFRAPDKSVYQTLAADPNFSNITKLINYDPEIKELLDEASHGLTFLAPNNKALTPPQRRKHLHEIAITDEDAIHQLVLHADEIYNTSDDDDDDDKDKERKKKILKWILNAVLRYHTLPYDITSTSIAGNSTVQTNLIPKEGGYGGYNLRIKVEKTLIPPTVTINKYAKIVKGDIAATNGLIHELDHPLLPPPSILNGVYLAPQWLSTFSSAIQKVGLAEGLDWHWVHDKDHHAKKPKFEGSPAITAFVPTNSAFKKLPEHLVLYLFSPVGIRALRKLLQFHVVPNYIIHAEWIVPVDPKDSFSTMQHSLVEDGDQDFSFPFPTALKNFTLPVSIKKWGPTLPIPGVANFEFKVLGHVVDKARFDLPAWNGAWHVVGDVLNPMKSKHGHHDGSFDEEKWGWENWEEWLPDWVAEYDE
ncbi:FAS1 domain-containing protein [Clavulina sp. PMI_390]|nr:FAS1 domain-containing protein [Clavulina sp. PMI_390]